MILVDTNVLVDVLENDPEWADWSVAQLRAQSQVYRLNINPVIYAELSMAFKSIESLDDAIGGMKLHVAEIPKAALFLAGKAFGQYRERGGKRASVLADFFIGAHAAVATCPILTRDIQRYRSYFPTVRLITPTGKAI